MYVDVVCTSFALRYSWLSLFFLLYFYKYYLTLFRTRAIAHMPRPDLPSSLRISALRSEPQLRNAHLSNQVLAPGIGTSKERSIRALSLS